MTNNRIFVGIDNGLDGAFTLMNMQGKIIMQFVMPVIVNKKKLEGKFTPKGKQRFQTKRWVNEMEIKEFFDLGNQWPNLTVLIEKPAGSKDVKAAVSMADSFATLRTLFRVHHVKVWEIRARVWQKTFWHRPQKDEKDVKQYALEAANKLWPDEQWLASDRCTTPHDGKFDSALIAEYARHNIL